MELSTPCSIWLAPSAPSACRAPPCSVTISRLTSAQSHCVSFCRMCRTTRFLFRGGGTSRRLEASCRPVRCAAAGCLLSVNVQASHCLSKQKSRHPSTPVAMQRADLPVDGWAQRRISLGQSAQLDRPREQAAYKCAQPQGFVVVDGLRSCWKPSSLPAKRSHPPIREQLPNWQPFPLVALRRDDVYDASASACGFPVLEIHWL